MLRNSSLSWTFEGNPPRLFNRVEDNLGVGGTDAGESLHLVANNQAECTGMSGAQLDQIAVRSGNLMDLLHAGESGEPITESAVSGWIDFNKHEGGQSLAEGMRIEANFVPLNDAALFKLADALKDRRWRHPHLASNLGIGNSCLLLKDAQYLQVYFVVYS